MDKQQEYVLRAIEERDIRFVRLWFTDVRGQLKSVAIAPAEVEGAFEEGIGFDGSAVEGLTRVYESDMLLAPDPSTFLVLPTSLGRDEGVARMFCDVLTPDGQVARTDPRAVLERQLERVANAGFTCYVHPEIEFYLVKRNADGQIVPSDRAGFFDHVADNIMTFRAVVEEIALEEGYIATFMPKPFKDQPGSGMHTHFSLFEGERNAFFDPAGEYQLSAVGRSFVAGLLRHASEITAVTNQHVNSYKRLWGEDEAPSYISWGQTNRSSLVRVPTHKPGKAQSARIEYRALDSAANPYLAFAVILAAGMKGIEEGYELPAEANNDVWALSEVERRALGIQALPTSLKSAVAQMANSDVVADTLGEDAFAFFMRDKESEWRAYDREITNFELNQFITQF